VRRKAEGPSAVFFIYCAIAFSLGFVCALSPFISWFVAYLGHERDARQRVVERDVEPLVQAQQLFEERVLLGGGGGELGRGRGVPAGGETRGLQELEGGLPLHSGVQRVRAWGVGRKKKSGRRGRRRR
jgi:hypothetical protein